MSRNLIAAVVVLMAGVASAADLKEIALPAQIAKAFPATARVRVVNVWATWCVPCVAEMDDLQAIDDALGSEVALIGVSLDDEIPGATKAKVVSFLDRRKIRFANLYYTGSTEALSKHLRFNGEIPITIAYDANGKELWRHQGRLKREEALSRIRNLSRRK